MKIRWKEPTKSTARTILLMNLASIAEKADEQVLPAVALFISRSLGASLSQLGILQTSRALFQALASPLSGILGDRYPRPTIIASGCLLWGLMTAALGLCTSLVPQALICCALNGIGLALVVPVLQSTISDCYGEGARGGGFGAMSLTSSLGGLAGGLFATNIGGMRPWGIEGWRLAFQLMAGVSIVIAILVLKYAEDPRNKKSLDQDSSAAFLKSRKVRDDIRAVLRIPSFQVVVLQGIAGMIPWNALVLLTLWLQLSGCTDLQASLLMALFTLGCAVGSYLGGHIGDAAARKFPKHGRILICQLSVASGLPLSFLLLKGLGSFSHQQQQQQQQQYGHFESAPLLIDNVTDSFTAFNSSSLLIHTTKEVSNQAEATTARHLASTLLHLLQIHPDSQPLSFPVYSHGIVLLLMGLLISWCGCNNAALFSDIVPAPLRSTIFALDRAFEGSLAAASAPLVGYIAESVFGFNKAVLIEGDKGDESGGGYSGGRLPGENAEALGSALLVCLVVPWLVCLLCYSLLHMTYPRDVTGSQFFLSSSSSFYSSKPQGGGSPRSDGGYELQSEEGLVLVGQHDGMKKRGQGGAAKLLSDRV